MVSMDSDTLFAIRLVHGADCLTQGKKYLVTRPHEPESRLETEFNFRVLTGSFYLDSD